MKPLHSPTEYLSFLSCSLFCDIISYHRYYHIHGPTFGANRLTYHPRGNMCINLKRIISNVLGNCSQYFTTEHYSDVIMGATASQIISLTIVYSTVYSYADQRKNQSSASLTFVRGIHRGPVNSPHKWPVTRKMFPFDDVIMSWHISSQHWFS